MNKVSTEPASVDAREKKIVRTSILGILANTMLAAFKAIVGMATHSIAVVLDAVNNLSDALSSIVTIIGTKLASRNPDKKHPLGHGRIEYLSTTIVSMLVLYAGVTAIVESVKKIIRPEAPDYSPVSLLVISVAVLVKVFLGRYVKSVGEKVNSDSLIASGSDATFDAILSFSVLVTALISLTLHINLEAWVGVAIAVFIIKAGIEMLLDALDDIVGHRIDIETIHGVKKTILESEPDVSGVYDLILHSYGPEKMIGSVHVEIPDHYTAEQIDALERRIAEKVYAEHNIILAGIGIYSRNISDDETAAMRSAVTKIASAHDGVLQLHGFYLNKTEKIMNFDIILDFSVKDRDGLFMEIVQEVHEAFPDYQLRPTLDLDI